MDQKLFLTCFVGLAPLVWLLPKGKPLSLKKKKEKENKKQKKKFSLLNLPLSTEFARVRHVYGYEVVAQAIADARLNSKLNRIYNATFVQGDLSKIDACFGNNFPKPDIVISGYSGASFYMALPRPW